MRIVFTIAIAIVLFPIHIYAAALVAATPTHIELRGILGEDDVLEAREFVISATLDEQSTLYPENNMRLGEIGAKVGDVVLQFPESYRELENVPLAEIGIYYLQRWGEKTRIELFIPYGDFEYCENHDNNSKHYLQNRKVFSFLHSGEFVKARIWKRCTHY